MRDMTSVKICDTVRYSDKRGRNITTGLFGLPFLPRNI